jgi:hypothetical protein
MPAAVTTWRYEDASGSLERCRFTERMYSAEVKSSGSRPWPRGASNTHHPVLGLEGRGLDFITLEALIGS